MPSLVAPGAEGGHEGTVPAAQHEHVGVRLVQAVGELGQEKGCSFAHRVPLPISSGSWCQKTRGQPPFSATSSARYSGSP